MAESRPEPVLCNERVVRLATERALATLELAVAELTSALPEHRRVPVGGDFAWELGEETADGMVVLKAVRIVSGINACLVLLDSGYTQEAGVLIRTIDEFVGDLIFLMEGLATEAWPSAKQQEHINHFYSIRRPDVDPATGALSPLPWVERKKKQAGEARPSGGSIAGMTPTVHGYYGAIMEMYAGPGRGYRVRGVSGTRRIPEMLRQLSFYVDRSPGCLAVYALARDLQDLGARLVNERTRYQETAGSASLVRYG